MDNNYVDEYELQGIRDESIEFGKYIEITTSCNIDPSLLYIKVYKYSDPDKVCRIFIDKPEYFISDFYLNNKEIEELIKIITDKWKYIIMIINNDRIQENIFPLIDENLPIPNYNELK